MNTNLPPDQAIPTLLNNTASLSTIEAVIQVMHKLDTTLPANDGVKWFNLLYLRVTQAVYAQPLSSWKKPQWLSQLDVTFAQFYFDALASSYTNPKKVPGAWMALFESRSNPDIERVQFALAGMNAHINHDLPLAVVQTCNNLGILPDRNSPQYSDFENVNTILTTVEPTILKDLATGLLGGAIQDMGTVGRLLAIWSVETARDTAWTNAELLWKVQDFPEVRDDFLMVLNRMTGLTSRGLLLKV